MEDQFRKQKRFSDILDHTFQLLKSNFSTFFLVFLILLGPVYLIEAFILLNSGVGFFRDFEVGGSLIDEIMSGFEDGTGVSTGVNNSFAFLFAILTPVAVAATLFGVARIRNQETFSAGSVIKQGFSRFFPILGSSIIMGLIIVALIVAATFTLIIPGVIMFDNPFMAFFAVLFILLGLSLGIGLLLTRWGFYLASVVFKEGFPGIPQSWRLTKRNTWRVFGLFLVILLITTIIGGAIEGFLAIILGGSVLYTLIVNLVGIMITMINAVAYAVIYFDLKLRQDGDDLREMIDAYQND